MIFRQALMEDLDKIMNIVVEAQAALLAAGVDQWQNGYPSHEIITQDITNGNSYVLVEGDMMLGTVALEFDGEPNYDKIYEGSWLSEGAYAAIHRIAITKGYKGQGLASKMIESMVKISQDRGFLSIKVDTHEDNQAMQKMLGKNGFTYCGIIYLADGNKRVAFEKKWN